MKIAYKGKTGALTPAETKKIEVKFAKIAKLLDARTGEREAHVILNQERHVAHAEITVHYQDHDLVGLGSAADTFLAMGEALDNIEKRALKLRERVRDSYRGPKQEKSSLEGEGEAAEAEAGAEADAGPAGTPQVFRVNHHGRRKPMTLEEALLEIENRNFVVYRDAETDRVSVLVRRRDGNFDLIEA